MNVNLCLYLGLKQDTSFQQTAPEEPFSVINRIIVIIMQLHLYNKTLL